MFLNNKKHFLLLFNFAITNFNKMNKSSGSRTFVLTNPLSVTVLETQNGYSRKYPISASIPAECQALRTIKLEDGTTTEIVDTMRFVRGQRSIWADEQKVTNERMVFRLMEKPKFVNGYLVVNNSEKTLIDFLVNHPCNEDNASWGFGKTLFREYRPEVEARATNAKNRAEITAMELVFKADFETKLKPLARYLGIDINKASDLIKHDLLSYSKDNPEDFIELIDSVSVERYHDILQAIDMSILRVVGNRLLWADGRQIVEAPASYDVVDYFSEASFDDKFISTWSEVTRQMNKLNSGKVELKDLVNSETNKAEELKQLSAEELVLAAKELGVVVVSGAYYMYKDTKARGLDQFIKLVEGDASLRKLIEASMLK